jgi:hypothetical protein
LGGALRHSSLAKQLADSEGFLPMHQASRMANLRPKDIQLAVQFSHRSGTPRFQTVSVPTDAGDQEFIRATSGHSYDVTDDVVSLLQNAAREARRACRLPPAPPVPAFDLQVPGPQEPDVGPPPLDSQPSASSSSLLEQVPLSAPEGVFAPAVEEDAPAVQTKSEGVLPVSLVDDVVP